MKKIITALVILSTQLLSIQLDWLHDYDTALQRAKEQKKDIYIFIGADKCRFCDRYKQKALNRPEVIKALRKNYVLVYLSRDRHTIPKGFKKYGVPLHYFLKPNGEVYFIDAGTKNAEGVFLMIDEAELNRN